MTMLKVEEIDMKQHVNTALDSNNECPENYRCVICQSLIYDPEECSACANMYCKACIKEWKKEKCPLCQNNLKLQPLNRQLKNMLDKIELRGCPISEC